MTVTVHSAMVENGRKGLSSLARFIGGIAYAGGLVYAGVRSYDLFSRTLPPDMLGLALLGIVAVELTALGLPLAIHYWTAPGPQRMAALGFYVLDLMVLAVNTILDSAHNAGTVLPEFMTAWGTYAVPALPIMVMIMWAVLWSLDPASREHDMRAAVRAATHEAVLSQIIEEARSEDIRDDIHSSARNMSREIVGQTLGGLGGRTAGTLPAPASHPAAIAAPAAGTLPAHATHASRPGGVDPALVAAVVAALRQADVAAFYNAAPDDQPAPELVAVHRSQNGAGPKS